jgi:catechol 2,3-dioxygenase-like lactoylglutathione lyase family enzyme
MLVKKLNHVAYRCNNARETVEFYTDVLGLKYTIAVSADTVPSIKQRCPYMHVFFEMEDRSYIAFFEVPEEPPMGRDENTPLWVQHLALEVADVETLEAAKKALEAKGIDVVGPTDHGFIRSIYFFDPNGHRLELTARTHKPDDLEREAAGAWQALEVWEAKRAEFKPRMARSD